MDQHFGLGLNICAFSLAWIPSISVYGHSDKCAFLEKCDIHTESVYISTADLFASNRIEKSRENEKGNKVGRRKNKEKVYV